MEIISSASANLVTKAASVRSVSELINCVIDSPKQILLIAIQTATTAVPIRAKTPAPALIGSTISSADVAEDSRESAAK